MTAQRIATGAFNWVFNANNAPAIAGSPQANDTIVWITGEFIGSNATPAAPAGWTDQAPHSNSHQIAIYTTNAVGGGADTIPGVNWGNQWTFGISLLLRGLVVDQAHIVDVSGDRSSSTTTNLVGPASSLTPNQDGSYVLFVGIKDKTSASNGVTFSAPTSFTMVAQNAAGGSGNLAVGISEWIQTTAAAVPANESMTGSVGDATNQSMQGIILVLKPLAGAALAGAASAAASGSGALSTAIQAAGAASAAVSAVGALTNWATVTLAAPLYTGPGGILDPNFWLDVQPGVGSVLYYDATNITIYPNGEISSTTNNCSAVVQFYDGTGWSVGIVVLTPQMVSYASMVAAAAGALSTAIAMAGGALSATSALGNVSTGIQLAGNALAVANAAAALVTGIQLNEQALVSVNASGALTGGQASLQGNASILATALAGLTSKIQLAGQVFVNSTVAGALSAQIVFDGSAQALTQANAGLTTAIILSGSASVVSTAAGAALLTSALAGVANAVSTAMGSLLTGLQIAGPALVQAQGTGSLSTGIGLAGGAIVDTVATLKPVGAEGQFGYAKINILSPTGLPVDLAVFLEGSACIVTIEYFNSQGLPFVPSEVTYSVQDVTSGATLAPATPLVPELSDAVTITGAQNTMINGSRSFELHQILFEITDGAGQVNFASAEFELVRKSGVN